MVTRRQKLNTLGTYTVYHATKYKSGITHPHNVSAHTHTHLCTHCSIHVWRMICHFYVCLFVLGYHYVSWHATCLLNKTELIPGLPCTLQVVYSLSSPGLGSRAEVEVNLVNLI